MRAHTQGLKSQCVIACLLLLCALTPCSGSSPCGDTIDFNGDIYTWSEGTGYEYEGHVIGYSETYQYCPDNGAVLYVVDTACTFCRSTEGVWSGVSGDCSGITYFVLGSCGSFGSPPSGSPTPTPGGSPTPMHVIVDNYEDFTGGILFGNKLLVCLIGLLWVYVATRNILP